MARTLGWVLVAAPPWGCGGAAVAFLDPQPPPPPSNLPPPPPPVPGGDNGTQLCPQPGAVNGDRSDIRFLQKGSGVSPRFLSL